MNKLMSVPFLGALVALVIAAGVLVATTADADTRASAYVTSAAGIYPGDEVRILGVPVGLIDAVTPTGGQVRVDFHFDSAQAVPADAVAVIVAPSLVSSRYLQLAPRYTGGPVLADGAVIPVERTAVPVEWDEVKDQLAALSAELGPTADDPQGSLARAIGVGADTLAGQGTEINATLRDLSAAAGTLAAGGDDLFGTVRNLQIFTSALATSDQQVEEFGGRLASVSATLDENRDELGLALADLRSTVVTLDEFVTDNRGEVTTTVDRLADVTGVLAAQQEDLRRLLHAAPLPIVNLYNGIHPSTASLHGQLALTNFANPGLFVCSGIAAATNLPPAEAAALCAETLGPLLELLSMDYPPITTGPLQRRGSEPTAATPGAAPPADTDLPAATGPGGLSELLVPSGGDR